MSGFYGLSHNREFRLRCFENQVASVHLPPAEASKWRVVLSERSLEDVELEGFLEDFEHTPIAFSRALREELENSGQISGSLIPEARVYFERLIGCFNESPSVQDYASSNGQKLMNELLDWHGREGLLLGLASSSHSSFPAQIDVSKISDEDLIKTFERISQSGDRLTQIGAAELGLRILSCRPEIAQHLTTIIEQIRDDDPSSGDSLYQLLQAFFLYVDGEVSRLGILRDTPPFYRRLASMAHATLICRELVNTGFEVKSARAWAIRNSDSELFYLQSLTDMKAEPQWWPDLWTAPQIKADFCDRIVLAATALGEELKDETLEQLILSDSPNSIRSTQASSFAFLPNPLEGSTANKLELPNEIREAIETQLNADKKPISFSALVNSAVIFRMDSAPAVLAAEALKTAQYRLSGLDDKSQLLSALKGLGRRLITSQPDAY